MVERIVTSPSSAACRPCVRSRSNAGSASSDDALVEAAPVTAALDLLARVADAPTILCSHGDVIPALVEHLAASGARIVTDRDWKKGSTWVLERGADGRWPDALRAPPALAWSAGRDAFSPVAARRHRAARRGETPHAAEPQPFVHRHGRGGVGIGEQPDVPAPAGPPPARSAS